MHESPAHSDILYPSALAFTGLHLTCLLVLWTGVTAEAVVMAVVLYGTRMFAITAGAHRYFSHRSFRTSRVFQFVLAAVAQSSAQGGILWWAAKHRQHHQFSDLEGDVHSPGRQGFWHAHVGWIFDARFEKADYRRIPDLTRYPELVWLDRNKFAPAMVLAVAVLLWGGPAGFIVGFCWSTVVLYHATFAINSLAHTTGKQRYLTGDDSRNSWWLALLTLGEGWHNNHHYFQASARQGFRWWEIDVSYYVLRVLSGLRVVWALRQPPDAAVAGTLRPPRRVLERSAESLAQRWLGEREGEGRVLPALNELRRWLRGGLPESAPIDDLAHHVLRVLEREMRGGAGERNVAGSAA